MFRKAKKIIEGKVNHIIRQVWNAMLPPFLPLIGTSSQKEYRTNDAISYVAFVVIILINIDY